MFNKNRAKFGCDTHIRETEVNCTMSFTLTVTYYNRAGNSAQTETYADRFFHLQGDSHFRSAETELPNNTRHEFLT
jgi:hypothetical protein